MKRKRSWWREPIMNVGLVFLLVSMVFVGKQYANAFLNEVFGE